MDTALKVILALIVPGDTVEITPIDKFPNAERIFKVNEILKDGFLYGVTDRCDGYKMPFNWIKSVKIINRS